jgi:hypothetical protein
MNLSGFETRPRRQGGVDLRYAPVGSGRQVAARSVLEEIPVVYVAEFRHTPGWPRRPLQVRSGWDNARSP